MATTTLPGGSYVFGDDTVDIKVLGNGFVVVGNGNDTVDIVDTGFVVAGNGNDSITIGTDPGPGFVIIGDGFDTINLANGGEVIQLGASGVDQITLGAGNDTIFESGVAGISGTFGTATMVGGPGGSDMTVNQAQDMSDIVAHFGNVTMAAANIENGGSIITEMDGNYGSNVAMLGGDGFNIFDGGHGSDVMNAGAGFNQFQFDSTGGNSLGGTTVINNFISGSGKDLLYLNGENLATLQANNQIVSSGGNTLILLDGGATKIALAGVSSLQASDITQNKLG